METLKTKRWGRSLISTCAASIQVTDGNKQSVGDFIKYAFDNIPSVWHGRSGGNLVYFVDKYKVDVVNTEAEDYLNFDENLTERALKYVDLVKGRWFSVPGHELSYDLTDPHEALLHVLLGNALALIPWRADDTFELVMHGTQLLPGVYSFNIVEMYIFDKKQVGAYGFYDAISSDVEYHLTVIEGKISGKRKVGGRKPVKMMVDNITQSKSVTKVKDKKKDRGISL